MTTFDDTPVGSGHLPEVPEGSTPFSSNPRHYGIDPGTPWPDDVPMGQDDTHWRFEDDPKGARRAEIRIGVCWTVAILASIGLMVVYVQGYSTQAAGICWGLAFAGLGIGMLLWARDLLPNVEVTASRGNHAVSHEPDRVAVAESLSRGMEPMARRPFIYKTMGAVGGLFGLATLFPLASLGPRPGNFLKHTKWGPGVRAVTQDGTPIRPGDLAVNGIMTIFPEFHIDDALSPSLLINIGDSQLHVPASNDGWNIGRAGRVLEDLHPRRMPRQLVQRRDPPAGLPVPPVDLRRPRGLQAGVRSRAQVPPATSDHHQRRWLRGVAERLHRAGRSWILEPGYLT